MEGTEEESGLRNNDLKPKFLLRVLPSVPRTEGSMCPRVRFSSSISMLRQCPQRHAGGGEQLRNIPAAVLLRRH